MNGKFFCFVFILLFLLGCKVYKPSMSEATNDPINQKLPKMDIIFQNKKTNDDYSLVNNIVRNEINHNIIDFSAQKRGIIEVDCKIEHSSNIIFGSLFISVITGGVLNLLGFPSECYDHKVILSFKVLDVDNNILDTYEYSTKRRSYYALYYGKTAEVCLVEATKYIMKKFRDYIEQNSTYLVDKLKESNSIFYANDLSSMPVKNIVKSDVDQNIPQSNKKAEDTYALIIANEDYQFVDDVNFAAHDGEIFKEYCIKTLGIPERQIRYCANASYGVILGGVDWLKYALNNFEGSKAIVYYCGHGIPDEKTGDAYIIPVDGKGTNTTTCYSLNTLYTTLANTKASNITYFMDACFTGANKEGSMLVAARGVARKAKKETLQGNSVVFSASSGDETAMTYPEKGHGLFTYFLLKKLQETQGNVSYSELADYINKNVKKEAFLINEKPQNPVVATSTATSSTWKSMTLK